MTTRPASTTRPAAALHWLVALGAIGMLAFGYWISVLPRGPEKTGYVQLHKSFGMIVFALALARIAWRARVGFPEPLGRAWERRAARVAHLALMALTVALPLSGVVRSLAYARPVEVFGLTLIPRLLAERHDALNEAAGAVHDACALVLAALIALHLAAAAKHHFIDRDDALARVVPIRRHPPERAS